MINIQPIEKSDHKSDSLDVVRIWKTIQGEGPFAGTPAVFLRLAGCNLQCPFCDTDYTSKRARLTTSELLQSLEMVHGGVSSGLVVITGGEPFRQDLSPIVKELTRIGHRVQIETNGTLFPGNDFPWDKVTIVCSPKTGDISAPLQMRVAAIKYVLQAGHIDPFDGLPERTLGQTCRVARPLNMFRGEVYVQPLDEQDQERNLANLQATVNSSLRFGHRLCVQVQKIIGLD